MKVTLADRNLAMIKAWGETTKDISDLTVMAGDPLRVDADAIVCPGNGLGALDGDVSSLIAMRWSNIGSAIRYGIVSGHHGEIAIGNAVMVPTGTNDIKWVIFSPDRSGFGAWEHAPDALLSFRSTRGALSLIRLSGAKIPGGGPVKDMIKSIVIPPLGRSPGEPGAKKCARQMATAIRHMNEVIDPEVERNARSWIGEMNGE